MPSDTNEWEFQGLVVTWLNEEIKMHDYGFEHATQEYTFGDRKRSDIIVWKLRSAQAAVVEIELKQPSIALRDPILRRDAVRKAQQVNAPYLALWNVRTLELYRTPARPRINLGSDDLIDVIGTVDEVVHVDDTLLPDNQYKLHALARKLLLTCYDLITSGRYGGNIIDATIFVESLKSQVRPLRASLMPDVSRALTGHDRKLGSDLRIWAEEQGLRSLVEDLSSALAGQIAYRLTGQILFYYAFRRREPSLPRIELDADTPASEQLRDYWNRVRTFDYEALFEPSILERVPSSIESDVLIRRLATDLASYDWDHVRVDVLGSIFEQLLPVSERITLGQYYTPPALADLVLSFTLQDDDANIFDPAVGSGTFLLRAHDRLHRKYGMSHEKILDILWGGDISAFPAELAVINLCRQDLDSQANYPKIIVRDFFRVKPGALVRLPVAKPMPGGAQTIESPLPSFDAIVGNPPYVRSQQLDDLQADYKISLNLIARQAGVLKDAKFDAFAYFIIHAESFLKPGGRVGFVTSAAWLTAAYGENLQRFLVTRLHIRAVIFSDVEPFFPYQQVNTVCVIAEKPLRDEGPIDLEAHISFVSLTKQLHEILPHPEHGSYWGEVDLLVDKMLGCLPGVYDGYRVATRDLASEWNILRNSAGTPRNWARPFRESSLYRAIFGDD